MVYWSVFSNYTIVLGCRTKGIYQIFEFDSEFVHKYVNRNLKYQIPRLKNSFPLLPISSNKWIACVIMIFTLVRIIISHYSG